MKLGIMQPYFFPYIGYFQLISVVDKFVIHDDVQYIKGGWINRNRILHNYMPKYINLPISRDTYKANINKRFYTSSFEDDKKRILRQIEGSYKKAPYFLSIYNLIENCFQNTCRNVSIFLTDCLIKCCKYLNLGTEFIISSNLDIPDTPSGSGRVLEINKLLGASHYINLPGGLELYNKTEFSENNIELNFIKTKDFHYTQFGNKFVNSLSIIDVMMFNNIEEIKALISQYEIL